MERFKKLLKSAKSSFKSVLLNYREFLGIYVAVLIVQLLLGVWVQSAFTNYIAGDRLFEEHFRYDVLIESEDPKDITTLEGIFRNDLSSDSIKDSPSITSFGRYGKALGVNLEKGQYEKFCVEYAKYLNDEDVSYDKTPRYTYFNGTQDSTIIASVITGIVAFGASLLIMIVMYSVRTNHYKFQYGIYMTYGADKKMLGRIALGELLTINTILLIPSFIISWLLTLIIYAPSGISTVISLPGILIYTLLSYVIVLIASATSLGELFLKPPVSLITTADNSNFVSSPRRSFHLFGKKMPLHYEAFSVWRYRKYFIKLISGAVAFSVIFVLGVYSANIIALDQSTAKEEFLVEFKLSTSVDSYRRRANEEAEAIIEKISAMDSVDSVRIEQSVEMKSRSDCLLLESGSYTNASNHTVKCSKLAGYSRATNKGRYVCIDTTVLKMYEKLYDIEYLEGYDAETLPYAKQMIVISEGLYGKDCFNFKPGDKVAVGDMKSGASNLPVTSDPMKALEQQIDNFSYDFTEYTVGAVIHDKDATETIIVGLNETDYYRLTSFKRAISSISVYLESGIDIEDISAVHSEIDDVMKDYDSWNISSTDSSVIAKANQSINIPTLLYIMSSLVLVITPVIWIFSQIMFFKKREPEFRTLIHVGATMKEIRGIHVVSSVAVFVIGFVANFALSRLACLVVYEIFTYYLPGLGILAMNVSFDSFVPWYVMLIYAAVSAFFGFLSGMIPYYLFKIKLERERKAIESMTL